MYVYICICIWLCVCLGKIASALQGTSVDKVGSVNEFGDEQLTVDVIAENLLRSWAQSSEGSAVRAVCSEEDIHLQECHKNGEFILCWDPLDGSSIIDCNWAVGSIVSIWRIGHHGVQWQGADTLIQKTGNFTPNNHPTDLRVHINI
ncbi:sedoheptulose-1,7-bisphosphatase, partial [Toxoplasma gondii MAS]